MLLKDLPWQDKAGGTYKYACINHPRRISVWHWTAAYAGFGKDTYSVRIYSDEQTIEQDHDDLDAVEAQCLLNHYLEGNTP